MEIPAASAVRKERGRGRFRRFARAVNVVVGVGRVRRRRAAGSCGEIS